MDTGHIDQAVATLQSKKTEWARKPIADKRQHGDLDDIRARAALPAAALYRP